VSLANGKNCAPLGKRAAAKPTVARAASERTLSSFISSDCDGDWQVAYQRMQTGRAESKFCSVWRVVVKRRRREKQQVAAQFKQPRCVGSDGSRSQPLEEMMVMVRMNSEHVPKSEEKVHAGVGDNITDTHLYAVSPCPRSNDLS
jgi:hypothetical protein